eukprot:UN28128
MECFELLEITEDIHFKQNYDEIIKSDKEKTLFLKECSETLSPVKCINCRAGSIIVTLEGTEKDLKNTKDTVQKEGLKLPSFDPLTLKDDTEDEKQEESSSK